MCVYFHHMKDSAAFCVVFKMHSLAKLEFCQVDVITYGNNSSVACIMIAFQYFQCTQGEQQC